METLAAQRLEEQVRPVDLADWLGERYWSRGMGNLQCPVRGWGLSDVDSLLCTCEYSLVV